MPLHLQSDQVNSYPFVPPNLLINGGFENWQRGTSFTPNDTFTADEWKGVRASGTMTVTRNSSPRTGDYCLSMQNTAGGCDVRQGVECYKSLEGLTLTLSVWVKSAAAATVTIQDYNGSTQEDVSSAYSSYGNWQRVTVVKTIRSGLAPGITFPHNFGIMAQLYSPTGAQVFVDGATLVVGNYPEGIPFVPTDPSTDMARCERFYETGLARFGARGEVGATAGLECTIPYHVKKAPGVTLTMSASSSWAVASYTQLNFGYDAHGINMTSSDGSQVSWLQWYYYAHVM